MATFTHSITWTVSIDGRVTTYSYSYDIEDVVDIQKVEAETSAANGQNFAFDQPPVFVFVVSHNNGSPLGVTLIDNAGPTNVIAAQLLPGEAFALHLSDSGGSFNETASNSTTALLDLDGITALATFNQEGNFDIYALHQAGS